MLYLIVCHPNYHQWWLVVWGKVLDEFVAKNCLDRLSQRAKIWIANVWFRFQNPTRLMQMYIYVCVRMCWVFQTDFAGRVQHKLQSAIYSNSSRPIHCMSDLHTIRINAKMRIARSLLWMSWGQRWYYVPKLN